VGLAGQRDGEHAARGAAGDAAGMRTLRADESAGVAVLLSLRRDAIRRDTEQLYLGSFQIGGDTCAIARFAESETITFSHTDLPEFPYSVTFVVAASRILIE
jgi:hypothetical protein